MTIVLPITSVPKGIPFHVEVHPPEGGLRQVSYIKCEDVRAVSTARLERRLGSVDASTMTNVANFLRAILELQPELIPENCGVTYAPSLQPGHFDIRGDMEELRSYLSDVKIDVVRGEKS